LTAGSGIWGTDLRWATTSSPGTAAPVAYTAGSDVFFQTGGANAVAVVAGGVSANSVTQTTNSTATTISSGGGSLTITGTAGIVNSGNTTFTINSGVILGGTNTYTFNAGSTITMGGGISETGTAGINKTGNSVLNLNASNSYSGGTTVTAGRLIVGASGTLGTNVATNNISVSAGGNLGLTAAANVGGNQTLSINSSSTALGGFGVGYTGALPTLNTSGTTTFGGIFGINYTGTAGVTSLATLASTLNTGGASGEWFLGSQGTGTFNGSTLAAASDGIYRLGGGGGSLTFNQANVITGANAVRIGANLTGASGTVVFGAAQNYTGATTVNGSSTLKLGAAGALGDATTHTTGVTINDSGIFDLGGFSPTYNAPLILNSTANGFDTGAFLNSGAAVTYGGTVTLQKQTRFGGSGAILLTGAITGGGFKIIKDSTGLLELQNSGTVTLGDFQGNRGTLQVDGGTTLNVTSMDVGTGSSVGAGLTLNGGSVTSSGLSRFGQGSGTASGSLTLNSGTLTVPALTKGSLTFNVNFNGGTLKANAASTTFFSAATSALVKVGGAFIDDGGNAITIGRSLDHDVTGLGATPDGGLNKSGGGTLTLGGVNTYTGTTTIADGTLKIGSTGSIANSSQIIVGATTTLDVSEASGFTVGSSNAQLLSGTGSINGSLTVGANGTLAIGNSPGTMTYAGDLTLDLGSISNFEINAFTSGNFDLALAALTGIQTVNFTGGTLNLLFQSGFNTTGTVKIFEFDAYAGSGFSTVSTSGLASGYSATFDASNGIVTVVPEPSAMALMGSFSLLSLFRRRRVG
jgi:autotransporter-associated beta strand protein